MPKPLTSNELQTRINQVAAGLAGGTITRIDAIRLLNNIVSQIRDADNAGMLFDSAPGHRAPHPRILEQTR